MGLDGAQPITGAPSTGASSVNNNENTGASKSGAPADKAASFKRMPQGTGSNQSAAPGTAGALSPPSGHNQRPVKNVASTSVTATSEPNEIKDPKTPPQTSYQALKARGLRFWTNHRKAIVRAAVFAGAAVTAGGIIAMASGPVGWGVVLFLAGVGTLGYLGYQAYKTKQNLSKMRNLLDSQRAVDETNTPQASKGKGAEGA